MPITIDELRKLDAWKELTRLFGNPTSGQGTTNDANGHELLSQFGFPTNRLPHNPHSLAFWDSVCRMISDGAFHDRTLDDLLRLAADIYPGNLAFARWRADASKSGGYAKRIEATKTLHESGVQESQTLEVAPQRWAGGPNINADFNHPDFVDAFINKRQAPKVAQRKQQVHSSALRVFLCHAKADKEQVRNLHTFLRGQGHKPWLDEEDLIPGTEWEPAIKREISQSHIMLVCLSRLSVEKTGFVQKEIRLALDVADRQPEGAIFIIPVRLEECEVPDRLGKWHWLDLFAVNGHEKLLTSLRIRSEQIDDYSK